MKISILTKIQEIKNMSKEKSKENFQLSIMKYQFKKSKKSL